MEIKFSDKTEVICKECKTTVVYDFDKWLIENPDRSYMQCPMCGRMIRIR